jgi:hypothetical protein
MHRSLPIVKTAEPAGSPVILPVPAKDAVDLIDEAQREEPVFRTRLLIERQERTDGKGIGPQVAAGRVPGR